jgi:hypothetical protein
MCLQPRTQIILLLLCFRSVCHSSVISLSFMHLCPLSRFPNCIIGISHNCTCRSSPCHGGCFVESPALASRSNPLSLPVGAKLLAYTYITCVAAMFRDWHCHCQLGIRWISFINQHSPSNVSVHPKSVKKDVSGLFCMFKSVELTSTDKMTQTDILRILIGTTLMS